MGIDMDMDMVEDKEGNKVGGGVLGVKEGVRVMKTYLLGIPAWSKVGVDVDVDMVEEEGGSKVEGWALEVKEGVRMKKTHLLGIQMWCRSNH